MSQENSLGIKDIFMRLVIEPDVLLGYGRIFRFQELGCAVAYVL